MADLDHLHRGDLRGFVLYGPGSRRRHNVVVEALDRDHLRHFSWRGNSGTGESVYVDRLAACARNSDVLPRRRRVAEYSFRPGGGQLQRLLDWPHHDGADGYGIRSEYARP